MLFSSITFLFAFLPVVLLVYYISPRAIKNFVLMVFSLLFYAWGEPKYVFVMLASIIVGYVMGLLTDYYVNKEKIKAAKWMVALAVIINLGILFFFKYMGFFTDNINKIPHIHIKAVNLSLPLGISFYTFQILTYSVDVYRRTAKPQKNIINLATYITLFPQLIAGPIVRYETVAKQLEERRENVDDFGEGVRRFVTGLGKKVLIANMAGEIFNTLSKLPKDQNTIVLSWICSIAFTLQIYFDFSGYSDMAIGLGRMFGFKFLENFNYPYISKSLTEFWRRWHISLSTWFRDYVYIPLGGNRKGTAKTYRNLFIVWFLTGFWHGASWNFMIWGLYYFVLLVIEKVWLLKKLEKWPKLLAHLYALFFINFGWVIFAYDKFGELKTAVRNMFGFGGLSLTNNYTVYILLSYGLFLLIAFVAATPYPRELAVKLIAKLEGKSKEEDAGDKSNINEESGKNNGVKNVERRGIAAGILEAVFLLFVLLMSTAFLASEAFNPFLYFRF